MWCIYITTSIGSSWVECRNCNVLLSCLVLSCLVFSSCLVLSCLVLSGLVWSCLVLSCLFLSGLPCGIVSSLVNNTSGALEIVIRCNCNA
jgi:hypothetical protein